MVCYDVSWYLVVKNVCLSIFGFWFKCPNEPNRQCHIRLLCHFTCPLEYPNFDTKFRYARVRTSCVHALCSDIIGCLLFARLPQERSLATFLAERGSSNLVRFIRSCPCRTWYINKDIINWLSTMTVPLHTDMIVRVNQYVQSDKISDLRLVGSGRPNIFGVAPPTRNRDLLADTRRDGSEGAESSLIDLPRTEGSSCSALWATSEDRYPKNTRVVCAMN